jgi:mono/diheme cytochrome c family protein
MLSFGEHKKRAVLMNPSKLAGAICLLFCNSVAMAQSADDWESGEQIFDKICQYCHTQGVGPVLTGRNLPPVYFTTITRNGLNAMPAFRPTELSTDDLQKVAIYLSNTRNEDNQ